MLPPIKFIIIGDDIMHMQWATQRRFARDWVITRTRVAPRPCTLSIFNP